MFFLLWDASALAQRYAPEIGHQTVNALFTAVSQTQMLTTVLSYSETCGALVRKRNGGALKLSADSRFFDLEPAGRCRAKWSSISSPSRR